MDAAFKSEVFKTAWKSLKNFLAQGLKVTFANQLKRAWSMVKARHNPKPADLSGWTKNS